MAFSEILTNTYYGNTVQEWALALGIILGVIIAAKIVYTIFGTVFKKLASKTKTNLDDIIIDMIEEPAVFAFGLWGAWYALGRLTFTEAATAWIGNVFSALIVFMIAWFIVRLFDALVSEYLVPLTAKSDTKLDDQLLPIIRKGVKAIVWIIAVIIALNNAGYNVGALLAGLGIGGLALAMAAKDTVANMFGGFTILTDKPFKTGDRVQINGFDGTVEEIGLRSTRIRTLDGRVVTMPNMKFSEGAVENVSSEPSRKVVSNLGLTYDTTGKEMEKAMKILKDIAKKHKSLEEKVLVSFNAFGDFAMNILFVYYIKAGEDILQTQTDINTEILNQFNKNKLEFAFPTQTIYTKK